MFFLRRHQARFQSERVANIDDDIEQQRQQQQQQQQTVLEHGNVVVDDEEGTFMNTGVSSPSSSSSILQRRPSLSNRVRSRSQSTTTTTTGSHDIEQSRGVSSSNNSSTNAETNRTSTDSNNNTYNDSDLEDDDDDDDDIVVSSPSGTLADILSQRRHSILREEQQQQEGRQHPSRRMTISLSDLEEERELARRRSSMCLLFAMFLLFRLWILALQNGDFGLLLLCLLGSSWTARWIRHNRDQEEELDRRIANYIQQQQNRDPNNTSDSTEIDVGRDDLRMLSFQAQLALAIMESQRQMMQGGYGHPDGQQQSPGVSDTAKAQWKKFTYQASRDSKNVCPQDSHYGSVATQLPTSSSPGDVVKPSDHHQDDAPHCSICLGEYEDNEVVSKLPCGHMYHDDCIGSWCSNHTRCPLCNTDLEITTTTV